MAWYRPATQIPYRAGLCCGQLHKIEDMMSGIYCITVQDSLIFRCVTPGTLLQYASTGRITKSAEEPTSFTLMGTSAQLIPVGIRTKSMSC